MKYLYYAQGFCMCNVYLTVACILQDIFTMKYPSFHPGPAVPGWQMGPPPGMGIYMQYNAAAVQVQSNIISFKFIIFL